MSDKPIMTDEEKQRLLETANSAIVNGIMSPDELIQAIHQLEVLSRQGVDVSCIGEWSWSLRNKVLQSLDQNYAVTELDFDSGEVRETNKPTPLLDKYAVPPLKALTNQLRTATLALRKRRKSKK